MTTPPKPLDSQGGDSDFSIWESWCHRLSAGALLRITYQMRTKEQAFLLLVPSIHTCVQSIDANVVNLQ